MRQALSRLNVAPILRLAVLDLLSFYVMSIVYFG